MKQAFKLGLLGGVVQILVSLVGMVMAFTHREIVSETISLGHALVLLVTFFFCHQTVTRSNFPKREDILVASLLTGLTMAACLSLLVLLGELVNLRKVFINASPALYSFLTFDRGLEAGIPLLLFSGILTGALTAFFHRLPAMVRRLLLIPLAAVLVAGILQDLLRGIFAAWGPLGTINEWLFTANGMTIPGTIFIFLLVAALLYLWDIARSPVAGGYSRLPVKTKKSLAWTGYFLLFSILLILPKLLGLFLSEVLTIVGLFILLGLGLNIVVGFAGLLDLGYVAFFAIGAYTMAVLTSPELGFFNLNFWQALPFAVLMGVIWGVLLGIPVLKMRGDYLAIATLGFGEIIRILVLSDFLRPWLGGAQGIARIPRAEIGGFQFGGPQEIYYLILAGCLLVGFISFRLRDSRLGRAWMAVREDEDVAQAMGINLVATKLFAFATGAAFSAISGAIFASKLGSVYPHSFDVMISINILCVIIVGGMGSIPGVIVGAAALIGLPELLREFAEYRFLIYGAVLVAMMIYRPAGLWPEKVHERELHFIEDGRDEALEKT